MANKKEKKEERKVSFLGISARILSSPHITEKASLLAKENQYVFKVHPGSTKYAIKKAVQEVFGVEVVNVRVVTIPSKQRRRGKTLGTKSGYKKAVVSIKKGQKIELMPR